jgi:PKD domain
MDEAGETVAVWERRSETEVGKDVQASTRGPGEGFSAPIELSKAASEPAVAITPSGEAVAVWRHFDVNDAGNYVIQASYRQPGGSLSAPLDVAVTPNAALPQALQVADNAAGDTAVTWIQQEPGSGLSPNPTLVEASVRPAGGSFSTPEVISPLPLLAEQSARNPAVAIDAAGEAAVVWEYEDGTNTVIQAAVRSPGGGFGGPISVTADGENAGVPAIAMTPAGEVIAVWIRSNGTDNVVEASTGGSFSPSFELSDAAKSAFEPELAVDPAGAATVVWTSFDGTNGAVEASTASPGAVFSAPTEISEVAPIGAGLRPQVAVNPAGAATVVWERSNGINEIVQASTGSGGAFSVPISLSEGGQDALFPEVAVDSAGDATAVWWRSDGADTIVQAAGYDADPPQLRNLSIPSSGMVGVPVSFSASPFDVWPIAATSFGFGDGASAAGTSVAHAYSAPGTYQVTVSSTDAAGTPVTAGAPIKILPSNVFKLGKLSLNRKRGNATLAVTVPSPGKLVLSGKALKQVTKEAKRAGRVKLPIAARGKALKRLAKRGRVRVLVAIAFTPDGGTTLVKDKTVTLVKKLSPRRPRRDPRHV